jgi:hypothetical protein
MRRRDRDISFSKMNSEDLAVDPLLSFSLNFGTNLLE